jgi:hypothetical protein
VATATISAGGSQTLDSGASFSVTVTNSGTENAHINSERLRPGQNGTFYLQGAPLVATSRYGTTLDYTVAAVAADHNGTSVPLTAESATNSSSKATAPIISTGTSQNTGTFGTPVRYTDAQRRKIVVQNRSAVAIQVAYSSAGSSSPPSWGTAVSVPVGQEFYDYGNGNPVWFRDSGGTAVTVAYTVELAGA